MILSFQVANFRSLRDAALLSLEATADTEKPEGMEVRRQVPGLPAKHRGVLPCAVVYGPNAGGKSNVIKALDALLQFLTTPPSNSRSYDRHSPHPSSPLFPFRLDKESRKAPTEFRIAFLQQGTRYEYSLSATSGRVHGESLSSWPAGRETLLFARGTLIPEGKDRTWQFRCLTPNLFDHIEWADSLEYSPGLPVESCDPWHFGPSFRGGTKEGQKLANRTEVYGTFLQMAAFLSQPQCKHAMEWFRSQLTLLDVDALCAYSADRLAQLSPQYPGLKGQVEQLLKAADLGIDSLSLETIQNLSDPEDVEYVAWTQHKEKDGESVSFHMERDESYGTQRLFGLAIPLLLTLHEGGTLVVDELHAGLHPLLIRAIVRLFQSPATNPKNAQLIFATHDVTLLDSSLLRRDQIYFAEKGADSATTLYSLAEFKKKPRKDGALMNPYLEGRFHALPKLADDATWAAFARAFDKDAK